MTTRSGLPVLYREDRVVLHLVKNRPNNQSEEHGKHNLLKERYLRQC